MRSALLFFGFFLLRQCAPASSLLPTVSERFFRFQASKSNVDFDTIWRARFSRTPVLVYCYRTTKTTTTTIITTITTATTPDRCLFVVLLFFLRHCGGDTRSSFRDCDYGGDDDDARTKGKRRRRRRRRRVQRRTDGRRTSKTRTREKRLRKVHCCGGFRGAVLNLADLGGLYL